MGSQMSGLRTSRICTDELLQLDIRALARAGVLEASMSAQIELSNRNDNARLKTRSSGSFIALHMTHRRGLPISQPPYRIQLEKTPCAFGGNRQWFRCPNIHCSRRVATLFGGTTFVCRTCWGANYRSQRETDVDRLFRKIYKLRRKLQWEGGCAQGPGAKPKFMTWARYRHICEVHSSLNTELDRHAKKMMRLG